MRRMATVILASVLVAATAHAADSVSPAGWVQNADGSYIHSESGVACPKALGAYSLARLDGPAAPNLLGTCVYSGGPVRVGEIRVRKFIDGVGETPLAIQNDRALMGTTPAAGLPPGAKMAGAYRVGPGPQIDGNDTAQSVMTLVKNGLLVDCISQSKRDEAERKFAQDNFLNACTPKV